MTASQPPQLVRLPDGRRLAFADYGPGDGAPCVVLSGMPGSRLAPAWAFPDRLLAERGVRLLGVDRPGYGASDSHPRTTALGVADDLGVLCAAVGLDRVAVLGISVGAPFALACAIRWPQRVGALLLSGPTAPWELPETRTRMNRRNRRYYALARRAPLLSRAACWLWARTALAGLRGDRDRLLRRLSRALPPPDREVLAEVAADPQRWGRFVDDTAEAFRQGGAGVRADLAVASRPWGFQLDEVSAPTWLWHGAADEDGPIAAARRMAQMIPDCQATFTGEGHLMGLRHTSEAIAAIRRATAAYLIMLRSSSTV
jgi:pimeloyl-ACP methyl ester carboxylesterase